MTRFTLANSVSSAASRQFALHNRRDTTVLAMAPDAARAKAKMREARHKKVRQVGYRAVRYQRFKRRRDDALEGESLEVSRARRVKRFQAMVTWLEAQAQVNAQEGTPRDVFRHAATSEVQAHEAGELRVPSTEGGQQLITSFFRTGVCAGRVVCK